jgi:exportin-2 (importin alpha re-exporter)
MPYVFQLLSQLLESQKTNALSEDYIQLLPPLINPELWHTKANTIPLVRLLQAYLRRGSANVIQANKLEGILGVWQKLISSKLYDSYGFDLLMTIFLEVPMEHLSGFVGNIFYFLLTRLQKSRTERYVFRFVELIYFLAAVEKAQLGPAFVQAALDQQGTGLFGQLLQMFVLPKTPQIKGREQIITTLVGITRFLTESKELQSGQYARFWYPGRFWGGMLMVGRRC